MLGRGTPAVEQKRLATISIDRSVVVPVPGSPSAPTDVLDKDYDAGTKA